MTEEILTAKVEIAQAVANIRKLADEIMKLRRVAGSPVNMRMGIGGGGGVSAGGGIGGSGRGGGVGGRIWDESRFDVTGGKTTSVVKSLQGNLLRAMSLFFLMRRLLMIVEGVVKFGIGLFVKTFTGIISATEKWRTAESAMGALVGKKGGERLAEIAYTAGIEYPEESKEYMDALRRMIVASPQFSKKLKESPEALEKYAKMFIGVYSRLKFIDPTRDPTRALVQAVSGHQWRGLIRYGVLPKTVTGGGLPRVGIPTLEAISGYLAGTPKKQGRIPEEVLVAAGHRPLGQAKSFLSIMDKARRNIGEKGLLDIVGKQFYEFNQKFKNIVDSQDAQKTFTEIANFFVDKFEYAKKSVEDLFKGIDLSKDLKSNFDIFFTNIQVKAIDLIIRLSQFAGEVFYTAMSLGLQNIAGDLYYLTHPGMPIPPLEKRIEQYRKEVTDPKMAQKARALYFPYQVAVGVGVATLPLGGPEALLLAGLAGRGAARKVDEEINNIKDAELQEQRRQLTKNIRKVGSTVGMMQYFPGVSEPALKYYQNAGLLPLSLPYSSVKRPDSLSEGELSAERITPKDITVQNLNVQSPVKQRVTPLERGARWKIAGVYSSEGEDLL